MNWTKQLVIILLIYSLIVFGIGFFSGYKQKEITVVPETQETWNTSSEILKACSITTTVWQMKEDCIKPVECNQKRCVVWVNNSCLPPELRINETTIDKWILVEQLKSLLGEKE